MPREELRMVQDEMLHVAHELTLAQARVHRLRARVELPDDDLDDEAVRRSLGFEVHGDLESAAEDLDSAVAALRRGGLKTDEILERELLREQREQGPGWSIRIEPAPRPAVDRSANGDPSSRS
jgi:hypothetical protein